MSARSFYPDFITPEVGHPTEDRFEIATFADGRGRGLVARVAFAQGVTLARLTGFVTSIPSLDTLQIAPALYMSDPWFSRFLLHACDPNGAVEVGAALLVARRAVGIGDVLSIDYGATEDRLGRQFACGCGAPNCRGWIHGRAEQPNAEGRALLAARKRGD